MLNDIRVIELSAPETMMAGRILCDLGADVIVVEPPGGAAGRRFDPFLDDEPGLERSLTWHALNRGKRGITLDLGQADGRALLAEFGRSAALVLEAAGTRASNPRVDVTFPDTTVRCCITPFLSTGAKRDYIASDLVVMAATGVPGITGTPERPPLFYPFPQSIMEAGAEAAIASLAALSARDIDGLGQDIEVPARLAGMMSALSVPIVVSAGNPELSRTPARQQLAGVPLPSVFACKDGYVLVSFAFGQAFGRLTQRLMQWAAEQGCLEPRLGSVDWSTAPQQAEKGSLTTADMRATVDGVAALCLRHSKDEFGAEARKRGLLAAPMMDMRDIGQSPQYRERGLWSSPFAVGPDGRKVADPARFAQFSNYTIEVRRPAPSLSQHTGEILKTELGLSPTEIQALFVHGII
jgi:crotonobetainyl-CoA:carnitine CoA-transferase CaiB-like acyl-CoA transferase